MDQMAHRVLPYLKLDASWKTRVIAALRARVTETHDEGQQDRLRRAVDNLRKQHQWGDLSDQEYRLERESLMRKLKLITRPSMLTAQMPNLQGAARVLEDLPALWLHPGVTHEQRESLVRQVFRRITIDGKDFVGIERIEISYSHTPPPLGRPGLGPNI